MKPRTRFLSIVTKHFGAIETAATDPLDALIVDELQPDELDMVEVAMALEDEFGIAITDDQLAPFMPAHGHAGKTLRDLLALIEETVL